MTVFGVALLAICTLVGVFIGDLLGDDPAESAFAPGSLRRDAPAAHKQ